MLGSVLTDRPERTIEEWVSRFRDRGRMYWVAVGLVILYLYLIVLPFISIFVGSFTAQGTTLRGEFQIESWIRTYYTVRPTLVNTIVYAFGTATLTTILACVLSWCISRTNVPRGRTFYYFAFIGFFFPPVAWEVMWVRLLGRNGVYAAALGLDSLGVYTMPGMVVVASIRWLPLALILLVPLFANMDKTMEDAGRMSGAGTLRVTKDITLPMLAPGIFAVYLLAFLVALGDFRVPLLIGLPAGIEVLAITIYQNVSLAPSRYGLAMTQSVLLVVIALPCLYFYKKSLGATKKYATISGQGYQRTAIDIGKWRWVVFGFLSFFFFITMIVPVLLLVYTSLLPFYIHPHQLQDLSLFSFQAYEGMLTNPRILNGVFNSFVVALIATSLLIAGSILVAWIVQKTDIWFREWLDYLSFSVIGIPAVPLAMGLIFVYLVYVPGGTLIYNTLFILIIAMYTRFIAGTVRILEPAVIQIKADLLEAGQVAGDSILQRFRYIVLPVIKENATAAWTMRFGVVFLEMPLAVMLHTRDTEMVANVLLVLNDQAAFNEVAAFGVLIMIFLGAVMAVVHRI